jgi:hypothetical protein
MYVQWPESLVGRSESGVEYYEDKWCHPLLLLKSEASGYRMISAGPDTELGNEDDLEVELDRPQQ